MQEVYTEFKNTPAEFKMIYVEGGVFEMGSNATEAYDNEKPVHKVKVSDFWMGQYPVTQALWAYMMAGTDKENPSRFQRANRPVENVSWNDIVQDFLPRINKMASRLYRLPTEVEWEYATKGGKYGLKYPFIYAGSNKLEDVGWYEGNSHQETQGVGLKTPSLLGLYDMSGNVYEWCSDWYDSYPNNSKDVIKNPIGPTIGSNRVHRGGSWGYYAQNCCSTFRGNDSPGNRRGSVGFRLVHSF